MVRIRMPTESTDNIAGPSNPPPPPKKNTRLEKRKKEEHKVSHAAKFRDKKGLSVVFIGNLTGAVTVKKLKEHFASCGQVGETIIRVSRGTVAPVASTTMRDRKYATMQFKTEKQVLRALKLDGTLLGDVPIIVTVSAGDLPEVQDIARPRLQNMLQRTRTTPNANKRARPLERKDTERDFTDPGNNQNRIKFWGHSFPTTIC